MEKKRQHGGWSLTVPSCRNRFSRLLQSEYLGTDRRVCKSPSLNNKVASWLVVASMEVRPHVIRDDTQTTTFVRTGSEPRRSSFTTYAGTRGRHEMKTKGIPIYTYTYIHTYTHTYIHIQRHRETKAIDLLKVDLVGSVGGVRGHGACDERGQLQLAIAEQRADDNLGELRLGSG
jgi:hypothetical protein